jgi:uncharacterized protein (DUF1015 family)
MAEIAPLQPLRYADPSLLERVVAPPYDVIDAAQRAELAARHEHNVVHLDLPEGEGDERYENARRLFLKWQEQGVLVRDEDPVLYRYAQVFEPPGGGAALTRKGFFALVRAVSFAERQVLPHEKTLTGPKLDRMKLSRATRATLSPQFMLYSDPERRLDRDLDSGEPFADFATPDRVRHQLWRVTNPDAIKRVVDTIGRGNLLIADGHHRYETAVALAEEVATETGAAGRHVSPRGEHLYTYALLTNGDDPNLVVFPTHRLVHSLGQFDADALFRRAAELFVVEPVSGGPEQLKNALAKTQGQAVCAVVRERAALLKLRSDAKLSDHPVLSKRPAVVRGTAVALLHDGILEHILGITPEAQAAKTNLRYPQDVKVGVDAVARGEAQAFFVMNPTPVSTIREVAEAGEVMPQKSTYFYPKVLTGLLFHTLLPEREVR